jgi:hypothetical protein
MDPWSGDRWSTTTEKAKDGELIVQVPEMKVARPDVAFRIKVR